MARAQTNNEMPAYASELDAYHRSRSVELRCIIDALPIGTGDYVLDVACGDGTYAEWLAERVGTQGVVIGLDRSPAYLNCAAGKKSGQDDRICYVAGELSQAPLEEQSFDLIWCAQSLISLPQPVEALRQMAKLLRPGGTVAILENDSLHQLMLPWPARLELEIRKAELDAYEIRGVKAEKRYLGRKIRSLFQRAGLAPGRRTTYSTDRCAPLRSAEEEFLTRHLARLSELVAPYLDRRSLAEFNRLTQPNSPDFLLRQPTFEMAWLDIVCLGHKHNASVPRPLATLEHETVEV